MSTLKTLSSQILIALVVGCALVRLTNGFTLGNYPKWKLAGWNKLPGFKARITQKGLDFFRDIGMETLHKEIQKIRIPDQHGSAGPITYHATNIKIGSYRLPSTITPDTQSGDGLQFRVNGGSFYVHGDLSYDFVFTYRGTFQAKLSDITLVTTIAIGVDSYGRPTASANGCYFRVGYVSVSLDAGTAWMFEDKVAEQLKQTLNGKVCGSVIHAINYDLEDKLRTLQVVMPYKQMFKFDYSLVESPSFNGSVDTAHKGEVYPVGNDTECPIPIPGIHQDSDRTSRMLFLWVTDYLPNSAFYVLQKTGQLKHTLTPENVPPEEKKYLNTSSMALKMLIPQIDKMYPNMAMSLHVNSTKTPAVKMTPSGIQAVLTADCSACAILPNKTHAFLFTLSVAITADLTVGSKGNNITWVMTSFSTVLGDVHSEVGPIPISKLQKSVNLAIRMYILPRLNRMGVVGVPLPKMDGFEMMNTNITLGLGFMKIGTDLTHQPSASANFA